ncbi:E3 SUMO-protein ligase NSE2 isoform X2 [Apodemus sylvaticus]|uniref:E3 SUMO-protein ligase NSE2 isoform X2 n=1 Tax=Apodemus sylvaticus TaxID=10129 RepID=UPI002243F3C3|nr:E3 SUMO-protein ligase NSE2 isoform X2 [Apodemus sylvaticus]
MPGRSSTSAGSTGYISFSGVESALSSLTNFQFCISSGMDIVSSVALDLVETQTEVSSEYSMDKAMVEFAKMDRELNHYVKAVQSTINHVKEERPEKVPDLKLLVEKRFLALQDKNSDADFKENEKFVQFRQQLRELKKQYLPFGHRIQICWCGLVRLASLTQHDASQLHPCRSMCPHIRLPTVSSVCGHVMLLTHELAGVMLLLSVACGTARLFPTARAPLSISTSSVWGFQLLHVLAGPCFCLSF